MEQWCPICTEQELYSVSYDMTECNSKINMVYKVQIAKKKFLTPLLQISLEHPQVLDIQKDS